MTKISALEPVEVKIAGILSNNYFGPGIPSLNLVPRSGARRRRAFRRLASSMARTPRGSPISSGRWTSPRT